MDTFGSDFDSMLQVFRGTNIFNLTLVASNDDYSSAFESEPSSGLARGTSNGEWAYVRFYAFAGTTYWIQIDGYCNETGRAIIWVFY